MGLFSKYKKKIGGAINKATDDVLGNEVTHDYTSLRGSAGKVWTGKNYSARKGNSSDSMFQRVLHNYANTLTSPRGWAKLYTTGAASNYTGAAGSGAGQGATNAGQSSGAVAGTGTTGGVGTTAGGSGGTPAETYPQYYKGDLDQKKKDAEEAAQRAADARAAQIEQENTINGRVARLNTSYGIGDSTEARANADRLHGLFTQTADAWRQNQMGELQGTFGSALRANRFHAADTGTTGSGMDAQAQTENIGQWLHGRNDIDQQASGIGATLQDTLDSQRRNLEGQIRSGTIVDMNGLNALNQQKVALDQATSNIPRVALGNLFTQAGQVYSSGNQAGAYGYRGFGNGSSAPLNGSGATSSRGSIG